MRRIGHPRPTSFPALVIVALTGAGTDRDEVRRVGTWAASPHLAGPAEMPPDPGLADVTLRQVVL